MVLPNLQTFLSFVRSSVKMPFNKISPTAKAYKIAIIGSNGSSGIKIFDEIIKKANKNVEIITIDPNLPYMVGGSAYRSPHPSWYLNVKAIKKEGFYEYLKEHHPYEVKPNSFLERIFYKKYLEYKKKEALKKAEEKDITVTNIRGEVIDILPQNSTKEDKHLKLIAFNVNNQIEPIIVDGVILCLGDAPPKEIPSNILKNRNIIQHPLNSLWYDVKRGIPNQTFVIKGFGLSAIDVILALNYTAKLCNVEIKIFAVQQENDGILKHQKHEKPYPNEIFLQAPKTADGLWQTLQKSLNEDSEFEQGAIVGSKQSLLLSSKKAKFTPQDIVDSLKEVFNQIWQDLPDEEKVKWYKDYAPKYNFLRHRITEQSAKIVNKLFENGTLNLIKGDLYQAHTSETGDSQALIKEKNGTLRSIKCCQIFNATEPNHENIPNLLETLKDKYLIKESLIGGINCPDRSSFNVSNQPGIKIATTSSIPSRFPELVDTREKNKMIKDMANEIVETWVSKVSERKSQDLSRSSTSINRE